MKKSLSKYLVWITLIMLLLLLFFQIKWMVDSMRFQEKVFQNSVNLALNKTINSLNSDKRVCNVMRECVLCDTSQLDSQLLSHGIWDQIHKSIDAELAVYNILLDYDLYITKNKMDTLRGKQLDVSSRKRICYAQSLRDVLQMNGYELVVSFPSRTSFFLDKAGLMLLSSVLLILLIFVSIMQMVRLYRNELRLIENIKDLINNVTHEFKTPISSIALASNLLRKGRYSDNPGKLEEYANLIFLENQKLQRQVDSLLNLAAIEWDDFEYHKKAENLHQLAEDAIRSLKLQLEEKSGSVTIAFEAENDTVFADKLHLTNAIINLLTNAMKYSENTPQINISTYNRENSICMEISDKGIGISSKYLRFIFDKYYRVPTGDVHNIKGFGIGLSYVKSVVNAHSGRIEVISEPEKGSTFTMIFPNLV